MDPSPPSRLAPLRAAAWALLAAWSASVALAWASQARLLFPGAWTLPHDDDALARLTETARARGVEEVRLPVEGDHILLWRYAPTAPSARRALLYGPGNAEPITSFAASARRLREAGWDVVVLGWRGYPGSTGQPSTDALRADARAAWRWVGEELGLPPERVALHGRSMGGGALADLLRDVTPGALVLESSFARLDDVAADAYPWWPVRALMTRPFDTEAALRSAPPTLVLHSRDDALISVAHAHRNAAAAPRAELVLADGLPHGASVLGVADVNGAWWSFLERAIPPTPPEM
jgi:acetyl esterase/lipase